MNGIYNDFIPEKTTTIVTTSNDAFIWLILSIVIAIVGGVALYFTFLDKSNENKVNGFEKKIYDFFNFKTLYAYELLKISYIILTIGINLLLIVKLFSNFFMTILVLIFGNLVLRISYELLLGFINLCQNVSDINSKLNSDKSKFRPKKNNNYKVKNDENKE